MGTIFLRLLLTFPLTIRGIKQNCSDLKPHVLIYDFVWFMIAIYHLGCFSYQHLIRGQNVLLTIPFGEAKDQLNNNRVVSSRAVKEEGRKRKWVSITNNNDNGRESQLRECQSQQDNRCGLYSSYRVVGQGHAMMMHDSERQGVKWKGRGGPMPSGWILVLKHELKERWGMASRLILAVGIADDDQPPEALNIIISSTMTPARVSYTRKYSSSASYPPSIFSALLVPLQTNYVLLIEFRVRNGFSYSTASFGLHLCPPSLYS